MTRLVATSATAPATPAPQRIRRLTVALTLAYLLATAVLVLAGGRTIPHWPVLVTAHVAAALGLLWLARRPRLSRGSAVVLDWYPIAAFPVLYKEVQLLAAHVGDWRLTGVVDAAEAWLFHGQPSLYLSEWMPWVLLSELLHLCYLAYLVVIPGVLAYWFLTKRLAAFRELVFLLTAVMLTSYLFFILWPVDSPFYRFDPLGAPFAGHAIFDLVHAVSSRGGARGGAFPSAHASGATVLWLVAWHHDRRLAVWLAPVVAGLLVATVFGRFHYVLDTVAGVGLGVAAVWAGRRLLQRDGWSAV